MTAGGTPRSIAAARVAVVGAGIAGLSCAAELVRRGASVQLFEASRSLGGRVASTTIVHGSFDAGAQYFTVHHHRFEVASQAWLAAGAIARWDARFAAVAGPRIEPIGDKVVRYVGVPSMGALALVLARGLEIQLEQPISRVRRLGGGWRLFDVQGAELSLRPYDAVVIATPSPIAAGLLQEQPDFARIARGVQWEPALAALVALATPSGAPFDAVFVNDDPVLGWAACDSTKPGRPGVEGIAERWVLHARPKWARDGFDLDQRVLTDHLVRAFGTKIGRTLEAESENLVRYRFATPVNPLTPAFLWDPSLRIGAVGDWCAGPRVEGAFLSGTGLAEAIAAGSA